MSPFRKLGRVLGIGRDSDSEGYLDTIDTAELENVDALHAPAEVYIKPVALEDEADMKLVEEELKNGNIILMNIAPMSKYTTKLKKIINNLKEFTIKIDGDIARMDNEKFLLTPSRVKIIKKRK
ncbi:MAG: cell division protein SepF [Candidatus Micrarchaeota archaeon]|nr:cell division protein SepF [Candidatus Micrarchaeota archaeon]